MKKAILPYLPLFGAVVLCFSQNVTIFSGRLSPVVVPSLGLELMPGLPFLCGLKPETLMPGVNYTTRWILPGGEIINSTTGRYIFSESLVSINNRSTVPGTILVISLISYQDAGTYTCEGRSTAPRASTQWASASFELQLNVQLLSNSTRTIMATTNDSTVALHCEMRAYIRPDSFLIWEGPGGQINTTGTEKYQISFSDGSPQTAVKGSALLVPSRVSTLIITNPESSDAGTYTCTVMGTSETIVINVRVNVTKTVTDVKTTYYGTQANSTPSPSNAPQPTGIAIPYITTILILTGLLVIAAVILLYCLISWYQQNKSRESKSADINATQSSSSNPETYYDYISLEPDRGIQHNDQPDTDEAKGDDLSININTSRRYDNQDNLNATVTNVDTDVNVDSDVNVAYGVIVDGVSAALEVNVAYGAVDTVMEENKAYGVAIDGIGVDTMERNVAYGTNKDYI